MEVEVNHEINHIDFSVQPLNKNLDHLHRKPLPVQLSITFVYVTEHKYIKLSDNDVVTPVSDYKETKEKRCQFDMSVVNKYDEAYVILSGMLFGIGNSTVLHDQIVNDIIVWGRKLENMVSNKGRKILALCVFIKREHTMVLCERCMRETMANDSNIGMVPASDLAIEKMLKKGREKKESPSSSSEVRGRKMNRCVSESESCTVCLEEYFYAGSDVACMPCSHVFHADCIVKWLRESHYCPICRFEMPTNSSTS